MLVNRKLKTIDGNTAAAYVSYAFTELAFVYPITPSSVMADVVDRYSELSRKENLFGNVVKVVEMQSEAGVAGALHGALTSGSLATTYTASQGLLLMIPNMYKIAGELLPCVIHVAARTIAGHALSIFGDHSDVYACRQTGFAMLCSNSPQEVMDLSAIAHLCSIKSRVPFLHFFDGFRTSHEIQKVQMWDYKDLKDLLDLDAVYSFKKRALNPETPVLRGSAQNDDIFFQLKEASNIFYFSLPYIVENYMNTINEKIGTDYNLFNYYGHSEPERIIVAMGSVCETIEEVVDYLSKVGERVGLVKVRLYRPFSKEHFLKVLPKSVKVISVLDRTKEPGALGEPLYLDVCASLFGTEFKNVKILRGRYGLSSKNTSPKDIIAVFNNMKDHLIDHEKQFGPEQTYSNIVPTPNKNSNIFENIYGVAHDGGPSEFFYSQGELNFSQPVKRLYNTDEKNETENTTSQNESNEQENIGSTISEKGILKSFCAKEKILNFNKDQFTIGIKDDVTNLSLNTENISYTFPEDIYSCKFWGLGSDGTVSANKNTIKIIGDNTDLFVQGYFAYDSKKSGGLTVSHLRFGKSKIKSTYYVTSADFVACHNFSYIFKYPKIIKEVKEGGKFLLNCPYSSEEDLEKNLPEYFKYYIFKNNIELYLVDAEKIAKEIGLNRKVNTILQAAFFKITGIIDLKSAKNYMKEAAKKTYGEKGEKIVAMNFLAIEKGMERVKKISVPESFSKAKNVLTDYISCEGANTHCSLDCCDCPQFSCNPDITSSKMDEKKISANNSSQCKECDLARKFSNNLANILKDGDCFGLNTNGNETLEKTSRPYDDSSFYRESKSCVSFVNNIQAVLNKYEGNELPVSKFLPYFDGTLPLGTASFEKRDIATSVPIWNKENCIQCNMCSLVCPHAVIRPFILTKKEIDKSPCEIVCKEAIGLKGEDLYFCIGISSKDCTSCGLCENVCPGLKQKKALKIIEKNEKTNDQQKQFNYLVSLPEKNVVFEKFNNFSVKGSQFKNPLLEFSGACAGCGETPYAKLVTQLFGPNIYIANATGCSSIWGGSAGSIPYTFNLEGHGPAWQNSLFEDNAEFGFGIEHSRKYLRESAGKNIERLAKISDDSELKSLYEKYMSTLKSINSNALATKDLVDYIESDNLSETILSLPEAKILKEKILKERHFISRKSVWIFGGDGWAYDIGFGGLDHVFAYQENINILVFDTEVYSNTGGQASKATPKGAVAQFACGGKKTKKKNLAAMAISYETVYVASVALGANMNQCIKAFKEASDYNGVSLIIAYSPCIEHGIKGGMVDALLEQKKAVECGHWSLFRYNPSLKLAGKDPFIMDSKEPSKPYEEFLQNERRFKNFLSK